MKKVIALNGLLCWETQKRNAMCDPHLFISKVLPIPLVPLDRTWTNDSVQTFLNM